MKKPIGLVAFLFVLATPALAGVPLDAAAALLKAETFLKGDPYGATLADVGKHITGSQLLKVGETGKCSPGPEKVAVWEFHVVVADRAADQPGSAASPIDGYLALDGVTGEMVCAGLPFLD